MPAPEPNSKMDEWLRTYAKKRKEQADPPAQMHPATRKFLQDEVKRTLGAAAAPPRQNWRTLRWPLVLLGSGFAALMVMLAVINTQMRSLMPASVPMDRSLSQARPMLKAPAQLSETPQRDLAASAQQPPSTGAFLGAKKAASAPAPEADKSGDGLDVVAGDFVQVPGRNQAKEAQSPISSVLSEFQMRRSGQNVRIVDADGSVYAGQVLSENYADSSLAARGGVAGEGTTRTHQNANDSENWRFKVTGTNHHLQQNIVFTGSVVAMPPAAPTGSAAPLNRGAPQAQNAPGTAPIPSAQNARITGKVQVGNGREYEIEAKPPGP
jgi:hypothetical protein